MSKTNNKVLSASEETSKLSKSILLVSLSFLLILTLLGMLFNNYILVRSFLLGILGSLFYLRMQIIFSGSCLKRDLLSILMTIISGGRIIIILAILVISVLRTDLFNAFYVIAGLATVHFISISVFIYDIIVNYLIDKKKLVIN